MASLPERRPIIRGEHVYLRATERSDIGDFVRWFNDADVLRNLNVERVFHRISQRPGKPMWFGTGPAGQAVFALPGNPVSTLVCCRHYVMAALRRMAGMPDASPCFAVLARPVSFAPELTYFLPVRLVSSAAGQVLALPVPTNTSGDFASLAGTDGYVELAREQGEFPAGTVAPLHRWR